MSDTGPITLSEAINDFHRARRQAVLRGVVARITGSPYYLLSYDEVRQRLKIQSSIERGLQDIPLDSIIGSVNRYTDFTRNFLPRGGITADRWANVEVVAAGQTGLPPIDVYQIGSTYFVKDGNHRVSVARQMGAKHIQAYVTEIHTRVPLSPKDSPEDIILKAEYSDFLEHTQLDNTRPEADLTVTVPGQYALLEEHISVHRYFMGVELKREITTPEAAADWYDAVYLPIQRIIASKSLLSDFPNRTETDLYLWIAEHRQALEEEIGHEINPAMAADNLTARFSSKPGRRATRLGGKIFRGVITDQLLVGPSAGEWRKEKFASSQKDILFSNILVPITGKELGWNALEQAIIIAQREGAYLQGLHILGRKSRGGTKENPEVKSIQDEFTRRCDQHAVPGKLISAEGDVSRKISEMSSWNDLIVIHLAYPPPPKSLAALSSGVRNILQRAITPILTVPNKITPLSKALLAYDGSPKSKEALFLATYIAGKWKISLFVVNVLDPEQSAPNPLAEAQQYIEAKGVKAEFVQVSGPVAKSILIVTEEEHCDLLLMGGYGRTPLANVVLGSSVDQVLRLSRKPVLICR